MNRLVIPQLTGLVTRSTGLVAPRIDAKVKDEVKAEGEPADQTNGAGRSSTMSKSRAALDQGKCPLATTSIDATKKLSRLLH